MLIYYVKNTLWFYSIEMNNFTWFLFILVAHFPTWNTFIPSLKKHFSYSVVVHFDHLPSSSLVMLHFPPPSYEGWLKSHSQCPPDVDVAAA